jgi:hypothetical protein
VTVDSVPFESTGGYQDTLEIRTRIRRLKCQEAGHLSILVLREKDMIRRCTCSAMSFGSAIGLLVVLDTNHRHGL